MRRSLTDPADRAYYLCCGPGGAGAAEFSRVAGARWAVEECFEQAKGECGLDQGEGRTWHAWHRHITLALFALAVLAAVRAGAVRPATPKKSRP